MNRVALTSFENSGTPLTSKLEYTTQDAIAPTMPAVTSTTIGNRRTGSILMRPDTGRGSGFNVAANTAPHQNAPSASAMTT